MSAGGCWASRPPSSMFTISLTGNNAFGTRPHGAEFVIADRFLVSVATWIPLPHSGRCKHGYQRGSASGRCWRGVDLGR
jgi:hypothetical protein